jgi:hypothetical protein
MVCRRVHIDGRVLTVEQTMLVLFGSAVVLQAFRTALLPATLPQVSFGLMSMSMDLF